MLLPTARLERERTMVDLISLTLHWVVPEIILSWVPKPQVNIITFAGHMVKSNMNFCFCVQVSPFLQQLCMKHQILGKMLLECNWHFDVSLMKLLLSDANYAHHFPTMEWFQDFITVSWYSDYLMVCNTGSEFSGGITHHCILGN